MHCGIYRIKLYITGGTSTAEQAVSALRHLKSLFCGRVESEIVDVPMCPELAFDPVLRPWPVIVRERPDPVIRFEGELADAEQIARVLRLD